MPRSLAEVASEMQPAQPRIRAISLSEFLEMRLPEREMLLAPWLPAKGIGMIYAPRGVGKTHFALAVAIAVASGGTFLKWTAPNKCKVLLIDGEMPARALQERLTAIVRASRDVIPLGDYVRLMPYDTFELGGPDLSTDEGQAELEPHIGDADLIVIDNLSTICRSGKENESESWASIQAWALGQRRKGRTVLFIHHAGKGGDQRGTSKREDVMDTVVKLSRPSDYTAAQGARFVVEFTKSRGFAGSDADSFEAHLVDSVWNMVALSDARAARIVELAAEGLTQREIASEVGCGVATVNRALKANQP